MAFTPVLPLQSLEFGGTTYIVSQVRKCRLCKEEIQITDGNYRMYFEKEYRIALHEHIHCPEKDFFGHYFKD
jgi:hypothetical protein